MKKILILILSLLFSFSLIFGVVDSSDVISYFSLYQFSSFSDEATTNASFIIGSGSASMSFHNGFLNLALSTYNLSESTSVILPENGSFSISWWSWSDSSTTGTQNFFSLNDKPTSTGSALLVTSHYRADFNARFVSLDSMCGGEINNLNGLPQNIWNHNLVSWDSGSNTIRYYINGIISNAKQSTGKSPNSCVYNFTPTLSLSPIKGGDFNKNYRSEMLIREFTTFETALNSRDARVLYNDGTPCSYPFTNCNAPIIERNMSATFTPLADDRKYEIFLNTTTQEFLSYEFYDETATPLGIWGKWRCFGWPSCPVVLHQTVNLTLPAGTTTLYLRARYRDRTSFQVNYSVNLSSDTFTRTGEEELGFIGILGGNGTGSFVRGNVNVSPGTAPSGITPSDSTTQTNGSGVVINNYITVDEDNTELVFLFLTILLGIFFFFSIIKTKAELKADNIYNLATSYWGIINVIVLTCSLVICCFAVIIFLLQDIMILKMMQEMFKILLFVFVFNVMFIRFPLFIYEVFKKLQEQDMIGKIKK